MNIGHMPTPIKLWGMHLRGNCWLWKMEYGAIKSSGKLDRWGLNIRKQSSYVISLTPSLVLRIRNLTGVYTSTHLLSIVVSIILVPLDWSQYDACPSALSAHQSPRFRAVFVTQSMPSEYHHKNVTKEAERKITEHVLLRRNDNQWVSRHSERRQNRWKSIAEKIICILSCPMYHHHPRRRDPLKIRPLRRRCLFSLLLPRDYMCDRLAMQKKRRCKWWAHGSPIGSESKYIIDKGIRWLATNTDHAKSHTLLKVEISDRRYTTTTQRSRAKKTSETGCLTYSCRITTSVSRTKFSRPMAEVQIRSQVAITSIAKTPENPYDLDS